MPDDGADPQVEAGRQLASFLYNDPETGPVLRDLIAKKFPKAKAQMPDVLAREAGSQILTEVRTELAKERTERLRERQERDLDRDRRAIMEDPDLHIAPDEIAAVEKLMQDEIIGTHRAAARLYRAQQQLAAPRQSIESAELQVPGRMGAGGDEFKGILADRDGWSKARTHEMIADFRSGKGSRWL